MRAPKAIDVCREALKIKAQKINGHKIFSNKNGLKKLKRNMDFRGNFFF